MTQSVERPQGDLRFFLGVCLRFCLCRFRRDFWRSRDSRDLVEIVIYLAICRRFVGPGTRLSKVGEL